MKHILALTSLLAFTACLAEQRTPDEYAERIERLSVSMTDTASRPAPVAPGAPSPLQTAPGSMRTASVMLAPQNTLRVRGSVHLRGNGGSTFVAVTLQSELAGGSYDGAIHRGSCARLGAQLTSVTAVSVDTLGNGRSLTVAHVPIDTLLAQPHAMIFGKGGRPESCADLGS